MHAAVPARRDGWTGPAKGKNAAGPMGVPLGGKWLPIDLTQSARPESIRAPAGSPLPAVWGKPCSSGGLAWRGRQRRL